MVGRIFGHLGVAFTRGRLIDLKLGHLGVQIFGRLGKRPSLELERPSSRATFFKMNLASQVFARYHKEDENVQLEGL